MVRLTLAGLLVVACLGLGLGSGCGGAGERGTLGAGPVPLPPPVPSFVARAGDLVIADVAVVDVVAGRVVPEQTVVVRGDRIVAVAPAAAIEASAASTRVDGRGKFLLPGLADMHVHTWSDADLPMFLAAGVTTVRNMFGSPTDLEKRARIAAGELVGPTLVTAGPIVDGEPPMWPGSTVVTTPEQAVRAVAEQKAAGYDFVKVYSRLSLEAYDAIVAAAAKDGLAVAGHVPRAVPLEHALAAGQRSIEHLEGYLEAIAKDGATLKRVSSYGLYLRQVLANADEAKIPGVATATAAASSWNCPTLVVLDRMARLDEPEALAAATRWLEYVPAELLQLWNPRNDFRIAKMTAEDFATGRAATALRTRILIALVAAGGKLLVGTDTGNPFVVAGAALHDELELLVAAGIPRATVLRAATAGAAEFLGQAGVAGVVAVGARADLVLADSNPLDGPITIPAAGLILRGRWLDRAALQAGLDALRPPAPARP